MYNKIHKITSEQKQKSGFELQIRGNLINNNKWFYVHKFYWDCY